MHDLRVGDLVRRKSDKQGGIRQDHCDLILEGAPGYWCGLNFDLVTRFNWWCR